MKRKHAKDIEHLPSALAHGTVYKKYKGDIKENGLDSSRRAVIFKDYLCIIHKNDNTQAWDIETFYKNSKLAA